MKTESVIIEGTNLKDLIWATLQSATENLKSKPGKSALLEFDLNGCKVECTVRCPKEKV